MEHKLLNTYDALYKGKRFWTRKLITGGRHTVMFSYIKKALSGGKFLDAFAGGGRLSFMASKSAKIVEAYDFAPEAKQMFELLKGATGVKNAHYTISDTENFKPQNAPYDVIAISGTLENLDDVDANISRLTRWLKKGGLLAIDCPHFLNFRGNVYNTLAKFLGMPMTKTDQRQVNTLFIQNICKKFGYKLVRQAGLSYSLGWSDLTVTDLSERIPHAMRDSGLKESDVKFEALIEWLKAQVEIHNNLILSPLKKAGILKKIKKAPLPKLKNLNEIVADPELREIISIYYNDDFSKDPYYSEVEPWNSLGGNTVYILKKI
jgi:ubiquinone/menaquinone biosynthesis C-methylase UbiE